MARISALFAIALLSAGSTAAAQEAAAPVSSWSPERKMARDLGGHSFLPSHIIDSPFSESSFGIHLGVGAGEALAGYIQRSPPAILPESRWYGYSSLGVQLMGSARILEYLSIRAVFGTDVYLGNERDAVLTVGTGSRFVYGLGVKGNLPVGEDFRFAATFDVTYGPVASILIAQGLINAINSGQIDSADFRQEQDTFTWIGGLLGSWAAWPFLGFTLNARFLSPTKTGKASYSQNGVVIAAVADFDVRPLLAWLPLGLNTGYSLTTPVGSNGVSTLQEYGFGVYYTGRRDLALGIELDWQRGRLQTQQESRSTLGWLNFRYYWD